MASTDLQYELRVAGRLSELAQRALLDVGRPHVVKLQPETVICCDLMNQSDLCGIVSYLEDLGLHVISIRQAAHEYEQ